MSDVELGRHGRNFGEVAKDVGFERSTIGKAPLCPMRDLAETPHHGILLWTSDIEEELLENGRVFRCFPMDIPRGMTDM